METQTTSGNGQPPGVKGARWGRPAPAAAQVGHKQKEMNKRRKESKSLLAVMRCLRASSQGGKVYKASGAKELAVTASMRAPVRDDVRAQLLPPCACPTPLPHGPRPGALYGSAVYSKLKFFKIKRRWWVGKDQGPPMIFTNGMSPCPLTHTQA